ncbi:UDP-N-acetylmuramate dehydrogenase [Candidatus Roizmanbacteria bacterium]|nr:UDP-N-acetylmuramate dehydrogenase [Candidatus Roizmanbacteria bacterium]
MNIQRNKTITPYFTLKTESVAEQFVEVFSQEELVEAVSYAHHEAIPFLILGGGSNIAVCQSPLKGLVIRNVFHLKEQIAETDATVDLRVSSGYPMARLVLETCNDGLAGLEYQKGLPGSVGGAVYMNSKWMHPETYVGDSLIEATVLTKDGSIKKVDRLYFQFRYDYSILQQTKEVLLDATFRFRKADPATLRERAETAFAYRKKTQPFGVSTCGCFFQNISKAEQEKLNLPTTSAGYLIDQAHLKGTQVGAFQVSDVHANFIINTGGGTPEELQSLLARIKTQVKDQFGVELHEEVQLITRQ